MSLAKSKAADQQATTPKATAQEANATAIARCREVLQAGREELAARSVKVEMGDPALTECVRRWGLGVQQASTASDVDWARYLHSRTCTPPGCLPSPFALLQERYAHDPWRLLIACVLMSRVSSAATKERCIEDFFHRCPTPTEALKADPADILPLIKSLGLFPTRMNAIVAVTTRFLVMPEFDVGLQPPLKIPGIGEFAFHSYLLFCRASDTVQPSDKNLAAFARWMAKSQA